MIIKGRKQTTQIYNPKIGRWVKIDTKTGRIISIKSDRKPYKNIPAFKDVGPSTAETVEIQHKMYMDVIEYRKGRTLKQLVKEANDPSKF